MPRDTRPPEDEPLKGGDAPYDDGAPHHPPIEVDEDEEETLVVHPDHRVPVANPREVAGPELRRTPASVRRPLGSFGAIWFALAILIVLGVVALVAGALQLPYSDEWQPSMQAPPGTEDYGVGGDDGSAF